MPNCGTMIGKSTLEMFNALHLKKKVWHRSKAITDTGNFPNSTVWPKFSSLSSKISFGNLPRGWGRLFNQCS